MLFAAFGEYLAALIAKRKGLLHSGVLTLVIISGAMTSSASSDAKEAIWSQLTAIFMMAPSAMIGGYVWTGQKNKGLWQNQQNRKSVSLIQSPMFAGIPIRNIKPSHAKQVGPCLFNYQ